MHMDVPCYASSGARPDIHADVETVRVVRRTQIGFGQAKQAHHEPAQPTSKLSGWNRVF